MDVISEKSIGVDGTVFPERRSETRRRVFKGAVVHFNHGYSSFECVVRNRSARGAKLAFGEALAVPNQFSLQIAGEDAPVTAHVRWRSGTMIGVELD